LRWVIRTLRPIPGLAWIPFAILWFGVEEKAAVFIIALGVFWIVFFAAHGAIRNVDRDLVEVADAFGFKSS
jgi:NitT/TauT family transport system permease protein